MSVPKLPVVLSDQARDDQLNILVYSLNQWGEHQHDVYEAALDQALETLGAYPLIGRARDDLVPGYRSFPVERHVIYYYVTEAAVMVVRILHGRMDARRALREGS
jgi:toxin ParE1/3/4